MFSQVYLLFTESSQGRDQGRCHKPEFLLQNFLSLAQFGWLFLIIELCSNLVKRIYEKCKRFCMSKTRDDQINKSANIFKNTIELLNHQVGVNCLHLAILQDNLDLVKAYLEKCKSRSYELIHSECIDSALVQTLYEWTSNMKARLPLSMAVLVGNEEIVDLLIDHGAELDRQDSEGYSVLHTIVLMSKRYEEKAGKMYSLILKRMVPWWLDKVKVNTEKTEEYNDTEIDENFKDEHVIDKLEAGYYLLNLKTNEEQLTPILLAAKIGSKSILERIINTEYVYRFTSMKEPTTDLVYYDISDIDAEILNHNRVQTSSDGSTVSSLSVFEMLLTTETDECLECLEIPLLEDILLIKWQNYFIHYLVIVIYYFVYLGLFTSTMFEINIPAKTISGAQSKQVTNSPFASSRHYAALIMSVIYLIFGVVSLISTVITYVKRHEKNLLREVVLSVFAICLPTMVICRFALYQTGNPSQVPVFGCSAVLGWSFSIFFLSGFRPTAKFSVMIVRLLFGHMFVFGICFFLISCGFAAAVAANMNYRTNSSMIYSDWKFTFFTLSRATVGLVDIDELFDDKKLPKDVYGFNIVMFTIYFLLACVFLLNMLIASMSEGFSIIYAKDDSFRKKFRIQNILLMERRIPASWRFLNANKHIEAEINVKTIERVGQEQSNRKSSSDAVVKKTVRKINGYLSLNSSIKTSMQH